MSDHAQGALGGLERPRHLVPPHPISCPCGKHLELACPDHGTAHVDEAIARAFDETPSHRPLRARGGGRPRAPKRKGPECGRCHRALPKSNGRPPKYCDACLTPLERHEREERRRWNETFRRNKAKRAAEAAS